MITLCPPRPRQGRHARQSANPSPPRAAAASPLPGHPPTARRSPTASPRAPRSRPKTHGTSPASSLPTPCGLGIERRLRYRPHTLCDREERLLAMQGQMSEASSQIFRQLNDADLKWPTVRNEKGEKIELGHSSFSAFLHSPSRAVRKN